MFLLMLGPVLKGSCFYSQVLAKAAITLGLSDCEKSCRCGLYLVLPYFLKSLPVSPACDTDVGERCPRFMCVVLIVLIGAGRATLAMIDNKLIDCLGALTPHGQSFNVGHITDIGLRRKSSSTI